MVKTSVASFARFSGGKKMLKSVEIPLNAKMIIIEEVYEDKKFIKTEDYFYNTSGAADNCEYSLNTTSWD